SHQATLVGDGRQGVRHAAVGDDEGCGLVALPAQFLGEQCLEVKRCQEGAQGVAGEGNGHGSTPGNEAEGTDNLRLLPGCFLLNLTEPALAAQGQDQLHEVGAVDANLQLAVEPVAGRFAKGKAINFFNGP